MFKSGRSYAQKLKNLRANICTIRTNRLEIQQGREKLWTYLTAESQNYLNNLAKETFPFIYQTPIEGIRSIMKEC